MASGDGEEDENDAEYLKEVRRELDKHKEAIPELEKLYKEMNASWGDIDRRTIGVLEYSPPISVDIDNERYTQDWATIRLDSTKIRPNFKGNVIDLGAFRLTPLSITLSDKNHPFRHKNIGL